MSWVSVGCTAATMALRAAYDLREYHPPFESCSYCQKAPDQGQKEARCRSCGAPLQKQNFTKTPSPSASELDYRMGLFQETNQMRTDSEDHAKRQREEYEAKCKKRREEEEERVRKRQEDDIKRASNIAMGDMMGTGIPGGIDMDITTPW